MVSSSWAPWVLHRITSYNVCYTKLLRDAHQSTVLPGYTHLQRAQPVTFAHWALAYVEMLERDYSRLQDALARLNLSPLGCGALAGTAYAIDREALALDMGFAGATRNSLDTVADRDHVVELMNCRNNFV